ncbi:MAG: hypothetical protein KJ574_02700 [Nanoarchaeota archaeon]|nr:hypothetical protein [Nanoarchaeota archaeon]
MADILGIILQSVIILLGVIPLYITIKIMGGEVTFLTAFGVKLFAAILSGVLIFFVGDVGIIITSGLMFVVYKFVFQLGVVKTIIAFIVEGIFMFLAMLGLVMLGIGAAMSFA